MHEPEIEILKIIPQKPPFVMVDRLLFRNPETTKTTLTVREENIFVDNGVLAEAGLIENIAQTCATFVGNSAHKTGSSGVKIGFIGMIRNMEIARLPKVGEALVTQVNLMEEVFQMSLINATVSIDDEVITSCEMKISLTDKNI
jgi:predicted hotdog family 3-hydroxylacyl-ACP dehydratase